MSTTPPLTDAAVPSGTPEIIEPAETTERFNDEYRAVDEYRLVLRPAVADDASAIEDLHARCSPNTLYRRYHAPMHGAPRLLLKQLLAARNHYFLVTTPTAQAVALGEFAAAVGPHPPQIALMVVDAWQRRGIGTWLTTRLLHTAARAELHTVYADVLGENTPALNHFRSFGGTVQTWEQGTAQLAIPVPKQST
ncbi:GNAT family N-acetyltransferase [Streptomyces sp. NPDC050439]|uniref:GNAT family N-acetyltransferase n=1 Tax=unclassified Streptomyces TaxID=2593676 RepID=UPI00342B51B7